MTKKDWDKLSEEEQLEIMQKCKDDPAYFYNNFFRKEGMPEVTREEMEQMRTMAEAPIILKGRRNRLYPLTKAEAFIKRSLT